MLCFNYRRLALWEDFVNGIFWALVKVSKKSCYEWWDKEVSWVA